MYSNSLGRWLETDPEQYIDGPNMYQMEDSNPVARLDPSGEAATTQPTTRPTTQPVTLPGHTWPLLDANGQLTKEFRDNYILKYNWGHSGPDPADKVPPYDNCGPNMFHPYVLITTRHDTLQIGNTAKLNAQQIAKITALIKKFNEVSAAHENIMAGEMAKIYLACSNEQGDADWAKRQQAAKNISKPNSPQEKQGLVEQLPLLIEIIEAAGLHVPNSIRYDLNDARKK